jgi:sugar lactone lactonase YvrE
MHARGSRERRLAIAVGAGVVGLVLTASGGAATGPREPVVVGPRSPVTGKKHVYLFSSMERGVRASRFRYQCSVDSPRLHPCPHRLTLRFTAGPHLLRVRAIDPERRRGPTAHIRIVARTPIPQLHLTQLWQVHIGTPIASHNFFDLAVGSAGRIYVADSGADRVDVYDADGGLAFRFGMHGSGKGEFSFLSTDGVGLGGIGVDPASGTVYVADSANGRIESFDQGGTYLTQFGASILGEVIDAAVASDGTIFTVEDKPVSVKQFTAAGALVNTLDAGFHDPGGVAIGADGNLIVPDYAGKSFSVFTESGTLVRSVTVPGNSLPSDVAAGPTGTTYVTDSGEERVDVFNPAGKETRFLRTAAHPSGIALGANALYVTTWDGTLTAYQLP